MRVGKGANPAPREFQLWGFPMRRNLPAILVGIAIVVLLILLGLNYDRLSGQKTAQAPTPAVTEAQAPATAEPEANAAAQPEATQQADASATAQPEASQQADASTTAQPEAEAIIKPSFDVVRVDKDGNIVVAGRAAPEADVQVLVNGAKLAEEQASGAGEWVAVSIAPLQPGSYELKAVAELNGVKTASDEVVALSVPTRESNEPPVAVANVPGEATTVLQATSPAVEAVATEVAKKAEYTPSLSAIDYDSEGNVIFSGRGPKSATVRLYVDNDPIGEAQISEAGDWQFKTQDPIAEGDHQLRLDALDDMGKVIGRVELPFTRERAEVVADAIANREGRVIIQPGNNLWRIARVIYGDGFRYADIYEANKGQIRDPDLIYPGQIFTTPGVVPPENIDPSWRNPEEAAQ